MLCVKFLASVYEFSVDDGGSTADDLERVIVKQATENEDVANCHCSWFYMQNFFVPACLADGDRNPLPQSLFFAPGKTRK